jgi:FkbM family methyltransferase
MKKIIYSNLIGILKFFCSVFGKKNKSRLIRLISDSFNLAHSSDEEIIFNNSNTAVFHCPNDLTRWRVGTFFDKEPETLEWIEGFSENDVFWDVGANIGLYSIYAASRGIRVLAFEPSAPNFYLLNLNIMKNNISKIATAYCLAFTDKKVADKLMMKNLEFGGALSSFGTNIGYDGKHFIPEIEQGMIGFSIDEYISSFNPLFPNHIKIDVDGIEDKIINGAEKTLLDGRLKSMSIELDSDKVDITNGVLNKMSRNGLKLISRRHSLMFEKGSFSTTYNYQFSRI